MKQPPLTAGVAEVEEQTVEDLRGELKLMNNWNFMTSTYFNKKISEEN